MGGRCVGTHRDCGDDCGRGRADENDGAACRANADAGTGVRQVVETRRDGGALRPRLAPVAI